MVESWLKQEPQQAIAYLSKKVSLPANEARLLEKNFYDWAFTVSNLNVAEILDGIKYLLVESLRRGDGLEVFNRQFDRLIERMGWSANGKRRQVIYQTNISQAYRYGRQAEINKLVGDRPEQWVLVWRHGDSPNYRELHKELHNKAIPANHSFWKYGIPPCDFGCRCTVFAMRRTIAEERGIKIVNAPPDPDAIWGRNFRRSVLNVESLMQDALPKLSPSLREQVEANLRERRDSLDEEMVVSYPIVSGANAYKADAVQSSSKRNETDHIGA